MGEGGITSDRFLAGLPVEGGAVRVGNCLVTSKLGAGGMGAVYLGRDVKLDVPVAVKVIPFHLAESNPGLVKRFQREARTAAQVDHPNLVRVYTVDEEKKVNYLVMEYVDGESVADRLDREGPLRETDALEICVSAGEALAAAHAKGIIHRDVKPANIIIRHEDGRVKLADLGLAKSFHEESSAEGGLTATGQFMGTPAYMSPEQAKDASKVDPRTDVYSLGATLYSLLTGRTPHKASQLLALLQKVATEEPEEPKEIRPELGEATCDVIRRMIAKSAEDRVPTMAGAVTLMRKAREALKETSKGLARPQLAGSGPDRFRGTLGDVLPADVKVRDRHAPTVPASVGLLPWKIALAGGVVLLAAGVVVVAILASRGGEAKPADARQILTPEEEEALRKRREADDAAFGSARTSSEEAVSADDYQGAMKAYEGYLESHPNGAHAEEAKTRLAAVRQEAVEPEAEDILRSGIEFRSMVSRDMFAEGAKALRAGRHSEARGLLGDVAAEAESEDAAGRARTVIAYSYIRELTSLRGTGEWSRFAELAEEAVRSCPGYRRLVRLAELGGRENIPRAAREAYEKAEELEKAGELAEVIHAYESVLPELNEHYGILAREAIERSKGAAFEQLYGTAKSEAEAGHWVAAIDAIEAAERLKPGNRLLARLAADARPKAAAELVREAEDHVRASRWKEARAALTRAALLGVDEEDKAAAAAVATALARRDEYETHLSAGAEAILKREWSRALEELTKAQALFPGEPALAKLLSQARAGLDDAAFAQAEEAAKEAGEDWDRVVAVYADYVTRFPEGSHVGDAGRRLAEARGRLDDRRFEAAKRAAADAGDSVSLALAAFWEYIERYPGGRHTAEAEAAMADLSAFTSAEKSANAAGGDWKTVAGAYKGYLEAHPAGLRAETAKARMIAALSGSVEAAVRDVENALNRGALREAEILLRLALASFPDDERLRALKEVVASRAGAEAETTNTVGMVLRLAPGGSFVMGAGDGDPDERPAHGVALGAYYIGKHEVTNAQYELFKPRHRRIRGEISAEDNCAAVQVTWRDAAAFCRWLSEKEGATYRLPTEAEWEFAARGTDGRKYPWGNEEPGPADRRTNWGEGDSPESWSADGFKYVAPVGSFPAGASPLGCLDMAGNVWEWCSDWYAESYQPASDVELNPGGPSSGTERVVRGGSWYHDSSSLRCANRSRKKETIRNDMIGFRVVREVGD